MLYGIDISNWQRDISIADIADEIDFAICKATEGVGFVDGTCDSFVQQLKEHGKLFGFYHFARENSPEQEAAFFCENCANYFGQGIPVLDYEVVNQNPKDWVERFCAKVYELTGIYPMVYTSASWLESVASEWTASHCGLWCAGYPRVYTSFGDYDFPYGTSPWSIVAIWQFTCSLRLKGYNGNLDGNIAYMDADSWLKFAHANKEESPAPRKESDISTSEAIDKMACDVIAGMYGNGDRRKENLYRTIQGRVNELCS